MPLTNTWNRFNYRLWAPIYDATVNRFLLPGRLVIFGKFQTDAERVPLARQAVNVFSTLLGIDITRRPGALRQGCPVVVTHDEPSRLGGLYRVVRLRESP